MGRGRWGLPLGCVCGVCVCAATIHYSSKSRPVFEKKTACRYRALALAVAAMRRRLLSTHRVGHPYMPRVRRLTGLLGGSVFGVAQLLVCLGGNKPVGRRSLWGCARCRTEKSAS